MSDYDEGYRAGMQKMRDLAYKRIEDLEANLANMAGLWAKSDSEKQLLLGRIEGLEAALLEAKSEMRDWGPDHPAMKMIDAALEGQNDE